MARARHKKFPIAKLALIGGLIALVGAVSYFGFATRTSVLPVAGAKNFSLKIKSSVGILSILSEECVGILHNLFYVTIAPVGAYD